MQASERPRVLAHFHKSSESIAKLQADYGPVIVPIQADLSIQDQVQHLIDRIRSEAGMPNKIVHLAALNLRLERFRQMDVRLFESDFAVQVRSILYLLREFLPAMSQSATRSKVVFVLSSVTFGVPPKFLSAYTTVKYCLLGLARALASEYAGTNVNINCVSPSMVETAFVSDIPKKAVELSAAQNPLGRNVTTCEVTGVIEFLLSPASDSLHGVNVPVAGGSAF